jgi:hypothetical protein
VIKYVIFSLIFISMNALSASTTYKKINLIQIQGDSGDIYLRLPEGEEWFQDCSIAYINNAMNHADKLYSAALAAKLASKEIAMEGECISNYFHVSQLYIK